ERLEAVEADGDAVHVQDRPVRYVDRARLDHVAEAARARAPVVEPRRRRHVASFSRSTGARPARSRRPCRAPTMPFGRNSVTSTNSAPRKESQNSGATTVSQLFAPFTSTAPIRGPTSGPRPPTATQIAISIEFAGDLPHGLMMPTCGT